MLYKCFIIHLLVSSILFGCAPIVNCSNILAIYPVPIQSDFVMQNAIISELIKAGHKITMLTAYTLKPLHLGSNYTEILIEPEYDIWKEATQEFGVKNAFGLPLLKFPKTLELLNMIALRSSEHALQQKNVQELINSTPINGVYDLLLMGHFCQETFLAFAYKYRIPVVMTSVFSHLNNMASISGVLMPWSYVPHGLLPHTNNMPFPERFYNIEHSFREYWNRKFDYFPKVDNLIQKYFSHLPVELPKVSEMERSTSLVLLNTHSSWHIPRPNSDIMVPIGGIHIHEPKQLPNDLQQYLDEASEGVIYFNLGSNLQGNHMPAVLQKYFIYVFAGLKQRVLWKYENESIDHLPSNILVRKWFPQNDILAHPNVKVFITHGGTFALQEAIYNAVPMLGAPIYWDQYMNMKKANEDGYAITVDLKIITEEDLRYSLNELLTNNMYKERIIQKSQMFRDRPLSPKKNALYWIEHVIRYNGTKHLRLASVDMHWFKYYLLDFAFVYFCLVVIALMVIGGIIRLQNCEPPPPSALTKAKTS